TRDPVKPDLIHITVPAAFYSDPETQGAIVALTPEKDGLFRVYLGKWTGNEWVWSTPNPDAD
ncbi:MAG TPA: hypothetical protein PLO53_03110, partial [Candidatus Hydrogenedentes bacterium]|nr:hypothetical protein [Candidatus Hydrogenedentota bacterium]